MAGLNLCLREILTALPNADDASRVAPAVLSETWHDSTLDLERGLDVVELPLDICDAVVDPG